MRFHQSILILCYYSGHASAPHFDGIAMLKGRRVPHACTFKAVVVGIQEKKAVDEKEAGGVS